MVSQLPQGSCSFSKSYNRLQRDWPPSACGKRCPGAGRSWPQWPRVWSRRKTARSDWPGVGESRRRTGSIPTQTKGDRVMGSNSLTRVLNSIILCLRGVVGRQAWQQSGQPHPTRGAPTWGQLCLPRATNQFQPHSFDIRAGRPV